MSHLFFVTIFSMVIVLFQGCASNERIVPNSTGKSSEILVVADKNLWNGQIGEEIRLLFGQDIEGLPQPEPMYSLINIVESEFSTIFQSHRNLFIISIKPEVSRPFIETKRDLWARPQRVIKINASSDTAALRLFNEHKLAFLMMFEQVERERIQRAYRSIADVSIHKQLVKNFGISMVVPQGYYVAKKTPDFMWLRRETLEFSQGILIYSYNYTDTSSFNMGYLIAMRDIMTEIHVPGTFDGTYMTVSRDYILPVTKKVDLNHRFAVETRGLWEVKSDYMGGPFISYTFVDEKNNKVFTLDGYVYAPKDNKRDFIRQMEAIFHTYKPYSEEH
ncbi:MAG: DUF4837 family protein [Bacteroidales bacterium]|nr:DUF4837 family protein [Bacteroidales bacterium]MDZ4205345.1 DUF4837 family protein [Bacteroidales bacterium]